MKNKNLIFPILLILSSPLFSQLILTFQHDPAGNRIIQRMECSNANEGPTDCIYFKRLNYFPNPAADEAFIGFEITEAAEVSISLVDLTGNILMTIVNGPLDLGYYFHSLDLSYLPDGMYFFRIRACGKIRHLKLVKVS